MPNKNAKTASRHVVDDPDVRQMTQWATLDTGEVARFDIGAPRARETTVAAQLANGSRPDWPPILFREDLVSVRMERVRGIEPRSTGWKPVALPLSYTRDSTQCSVRRKKSVGLSSWRAALIWELTAAAVDHDELAAAVSEQLARVLDHRVIRVHTFSRSRSRTTSTSS
jgi:hypothetical protein